jgi:hypothetical protein
MVAMGNVGHTGSTSATRAGTSSTAGDGITREEDPAINPPPPRELRALEARAGAAQLTWLAPVRVTHRNRDRIVAYRVYRRDPGAAEFVPIATTTATLSTDSAVFGGATYAYSVTDVREHNVESGRSEPVEVTVP